MRLPKEGECCCYIYNRDRAILNLREGVFITKRMALLALLFYPLNSPLVLYMVHLIPLELIRSKRDSVRKAREAHS